MNGELLVGLLGLLAIAACWSLAFVLYRVGPEGSVARRLSALLVVEGVVLITAGFPDFVLGIDDSFYEMHPTFELFGGAIHHLGDAIMIALYPPFLAMALQTPMARPFERRAPRVTLWVMAIMMACGSVVSFAIWDSFTGSAILYVAVMLTFLFALLVSINSWHRAKPGLARTRARLFMVAFGIRDALWFLSYGSAFYIIVKSLDWQESELFWIGKTVYALGTLLAVPLIAYGILRAHLFDIDLRIRWTIKQSTLAAIIVSFIFLVSEGASTFLSAEMGTVAGLFGAAVVIFFLTPLQRFADRVAASAMPNTENTPEYVAFRKMQVYEAALVDALAEGGISPKERALLTHLRISLGITESDALAIEQELIGHPFDPAVAKA